MTIYILCIETKTGGTLYYADRDKQEFLLRARSLRLPDLDTFDARIVHADDEESAIAWITATAATVYRGWAKAEKVKELEDGFTD